LALDVAKPESWRLSLAAYPISGEFQTRFQDLDINGHLNNVAFAALLENARVFLHLEARLMDSLGKGERTMVAAFQVNYLGEGSYPEPVIIGSGIGEVRNSSWTIVQAMFQNGRCISTGDTVVACRGPDGALPVKAELRAKLERLLVTTG
jgi:acyl-CoA thioester hydrolase